MKNKNISRKKNLPKNKKISRKKNFNKNKNNLKKSRRKKITTKKRNRIYVVGKKRTRTKRKYGGGKKRTKRRKYGGSVEQSEARKMWGKVVKHVKKSNEPKLEDLVDKVVLDKKCLPKTMNFNYLQTEIIPKYKYITKNPFKLFEKGTIGYGSINQLINYFQGKPLGKPENKHIRNTEVLKVELKCPAKSKRSRLSKLSQTSQTSQTVDAKLIQPLDKTNNVITAEHNNLFIMAKFHSTPPKAAAEAAKAEILNKKNVLNFFGLSETYDTYSSIDINYIITEHCPYVLKTLLQNSHKLINTNELKLNAIKGIANGMKYLSDKSNFKDNDHIVIHRNLCADNILVNEDGVCKVSGFEMAVLGNYDGDNFGIELNTDSFTDHRDENKNKFSHVDLPDVETELDKIIQKNKHIKHLTAYELTNFFDNPENPENLDETIKKNIEKLLKTINEIIETFITNYYNTIISVDLLKTIRDDYKEMYEANEEETYEKMKKKIDYYFNYFNSYIEFYIECINKFINIQTKPTKNPMNLDKIFNEIINALDAFFTDGKKYFFAYILNEKTQNVLNKYKLELDGTADEGGKLFEKLTKTKNKVYRWNTIKDSDGIQQLYATENLIYDDDSKMTFHNVWMGVHLFMTQYLMKYNLFFNDLNKLSEKINKGVKINNGVSVGLRKITNVNEKVLKCGDLTDRAYVDRNKKDKDTKELKITDKINIGISAPELLFLNPFSDKSDVWAFGMTIWEILNDGKDPWENEDKIQIQQSIREGNTKKIHEMILDPDDSEYIVEEPSIPKLGMNTVNKGDKFLLVKSNTGFTAGDDIIIDSNTGFTAGDDIIIDEGEQNQETNHIVNIIHDEESLEPIRVAVAFPLKFQHETDFTVKKHSPPLDIWNLSIYERPDFEQIVNKLDKLDELDKLNIPDTKLKNALIQNLFNTKTNDSLAVEEEIGVSSDAATAAADVSVAVPDSDAPANPFNLHEVEVYTSGLTNVLGPTNVLGNLGVMKAENIQNEKKKKY